MPIHAWTRVEAGTFHHFHHRWTAAIADALNGGLLPPGYIALVEQVTGRPILDVVTRGPRESIIYASLADRIVIRHGRREVVAVIEIISPGMKENRHTIRSFVEKASGILNQGVSLLL